VRHTRRIGFLEVRTGRGLYALKTVFPVCAGWGIKPGEPGACSLGQDNFRKLPEASDVKRKTVMSLAPFREIPRDVQKEEGPNRHVFRKTRKDAPTHRAGTPCAPI